MKNRIGWWLALVYVCAGGMDHFANTDEYVLAQQPSAVATTVQPPPVDTAGTDVQNSSGAYETAVKPLLEQNCVGCHNAAKMKGDLDLERFLSKSPSEALKDRAALELVIQKLKAGEMPPPGKPKPTSAQIDAATSWIEQQYAALDSKAAPNAGRVVAHRLNRYEYNNAVRDLLDVNLRFADDFPPDPYGYGFDNIGDVLSLSPMLTEKYMKAAETVAHAAIPVGAPMKASQVRYEPFKLGQDHRFDVTVTHDFPADGTYTLRYGWEEVVPQNTVATGRIYLDGKLLRQEHLLIDVNKEKAFYVRDVPVTQGPHQFEAFMEMAPLAQQPPHRGRLYPTYVTEMEVIGPSKTVPASQTASYRRIFFNGPPTGSHQAEYNREIIARLARRAYRRPVTAADVDRLVRLTRMVRSHGGSFESGVQIALEAILMSPDFLFRIEQDPQSGDIHRISDIELSSRLSFFLWSSMPDDELLALAEKGQLHDPEILHAQVRRMLADPKAHSLASNFAGEWLETRNLQFQKPDHKAFPDYDAQLEADMRTETEMFFQAVVSEDRSILDFLDGDYTFLNDRLATLYGIPGVEGREFRRVSLDGTERSGVITQASVLTASSYPTRTSPVIRGKWVLENILNTPPPPPPANVPALDDHNLGSAASVRQRLEEHRANPACAACHARMDPLGFALENYDAIGRWRTTEGSLPIDSKGQLPDGSTFSGAHELKALLRTKSPQFVRGFTEKMLTYSLGRGLETYDRPAVEKIAGRVEANGDRFSVLVDSIVDSLPFQMRQREAPATPVIPSSILHTTLTTTHPTHGG